MPSLDVRPFTTTAEYERVCDYFVTADPAYLRGMGIEPAKLLSRDQWLVRPLADHARPDREKQLCYVGWFCDDEAVGHSSINKIVYGEEAHIHLHLWRAEHRRAGIGTELFRLSANYFRRRFELARLYCEPWAENPAPNRVLEKLGFRFERRYRTVPGLNHFEQDVNRYVLERELA
jgi:ribosomal-protein-alanine N-acetyltransferase